MDQNERPQYYEGQYLGAEDLAAIVRYARAGQARHALGAHTWGIALGLELVERPLPDGSIALSLTPGYGWDGIGRPIVVLAPATVGLTLFQNFQDVTDANGLPVEIWLSYHELPTQSPAAGFAACREGQLYERVIESYTIEALRPPIDNTHSVSIAARSFDPKNAVSAFNPSGKTLYDESVSYQAFPDSGDLPRWRLFVGIARWVNEANKSPRLIKRTDDDLNATRKKRRYVGLVSEAIQAPDGVLRLRDRGNDPDDTTLNFQPPLPKPPAPAPDKDLVWVEGNLRVIGDARLVAGKLDYRVQKGGDGGIPVLLRRVDATSPAMTTLEAAVGVPPPGAESRFAISALDSSGNATPKVTVLMDTGNVGIGTESPTAQLHVQSTGGNLQFFSQTADVEYDGGSDGLFVFKDTGGKTAFVGGNVGIGTTSPTHKLHVDSNSGIRQNRLYLSGGDGWSSITYNAYHDAGNTAWVFPDSSRKAVTIELDDASGAPRFEVYSNLTAAPSGWRSHLKVTGADDTTVMAYNGGRVGIGTTAPGNKLEISGAGGLSVDLRVNGRIQTGDGGNAGGVWLDAGQTMFVGQYGTNAGFWRPAVGWNAFQIDPNGNVGINTTTPTVKLDVVGDMHLNGNAFVESFGWWSTSDREEKHDIASIERPLERLLGLRGVRFAWKEPAKHGGASGHQLGFVAQDVETVFPDWVKQTPWGSKAVNVGGLNALVVEALRELSATCDRMQEEIRRLTERLGKGGPPPARNEPDEKPHSARRSAKK